MRPIPSRTTRFVDALTLAQSVAALVLLAWSRNPALMALGVIFALPLVLAVGARVVRGVYFAATGRELVPPGRGRGERPPARLGKPSWERSMANVPPRSRRG
jgi:hypothetical protein